ncbi:MAG: hypothetical protein ACREQ5_24275, partial [Candidatus Dormibacteria bacterium]
MQQKKDWVASLSPERRAKLKRYMSAMHLKRKYNLTPEAKEKMYQEQRGLGYLCNRPLISCQEAI